MNRTPLKAVLPAVLTLALTACASTRGIAPESSMKSPDRWSANTALVSTKLSTAAWPTAQWWQAMGDVQLDRIMTDALAGSPSIDAANARLRKALAQAGLAEAGLQPTLGVSAQESHIQLPETLAPPPIGGKMLNASIVALNFSWAPDIWGGKHAKYDAAIGQARALEAESHGARASLVNNIAMAYVALAQAYDLRDAAIADVERNSSLRALATQRVKAGIDNQIALSQIVTAETQARFQQQVADQQILALKNALGMLAGQGPDYGLKLNRPTLVSNALSVPSTLPSELVSRRADVVAARWRVEAASRGIDASKADFYPSLNLSAMVGLAAGNLKNLFGTDALLLNGGPAISLPILDGGRLRNQLKASDADFDLAVASYDQTVLNAIKEIVDAVQLARATDLELATTTAARDAAKRSADLTRQRRAAGLASQLDVLNAQKPILQIDQQLLQLRGKRNEAWVRLNTALGGGVPLNEAQAAHGLDTKHTAKGKAQ